MTAWWLFPTKALGTVTVDRDWSSWSADNIPGICISLTPSRALALSALVANSFWGRILFVTTTGEVLIYDGQGKRVKAMMLPQGAEVTSPSALSTTTSKVAESKKDEDDDSDTDAKGEGGEIGVWRGKVDL